MDNRRGTFNVSLRRCVRSNFGLLQKHRSGAETGPTDPGCRPRARLCIPPGHEGCCAGRCFQKNGSCDNHGNRSDRSGYVLLVDGYQPFVSPEIIFNSFFIEGPFRLKFRGHQPQYHPERLVVERVECTPVSHNSGAAATGTIGLVPVGTGFWPAIRSITSNPPAHGAG